MAKYITPTLTITSNAYNATTNPGPTTSPLAISVADTLLSLAETDAPGGISISGSEPSKKRRASTEPTFFTYMKLQVALSCLIV